VSQELRIRLLANARKDPVASLIQFEGARPSNTGGRSGDQHGPFVWFWGVLHQPILPFFAQEDLSSLPS
jgi:hypothetical protein